MNYIIKRIDQDGGYIAKPGCKKSYTFNVKHMRKFATREQAQKELCVENEVVVSVAEVMD